MSEQGQPPAPAAPAPPEPNRLRSLVIAVAIAVAGGIYVVSHDTSSSGPTSAVARGTVNPRLLANPGALIGRPRLQLSPAQIAAVRAMKARPPAAAMSAAPTSTPAPVPASTDPASH